MRNGKNTANVHNDNYSEKIGAKKLNSQAPVHLRKYYKTKQTFNFFAALLTMWLFVFVIIFPHLQNLCLNNVVASPGTYYFRVAIILKDSLENPPTGWSVFDGHPESTYSDGQKLSTGGNVIYCELGSLSKSETFSNLTCSLPIKELNGVYYLERLKDGTNYSLVDDQNPTYVIDDRSTSDVFYMWEPSLAFVQYEYWVFTAVYEAPKPEKMSLSMTCDNYDKQSYLIFVYQGDDFLMQITPASSSQTLEFSELTDFDNNKLKICFVFGYYGNITFDSLTNATPNGRNVQIDTFANASFHYKIATPNINSSVMI